jgi:outer membrane lipoprotein-sorting protein
MRAFRATLALLAALAAAASAARAEEPAALPGGDELVRRINARDEGRQVSRRLVMELADKRGDVRVRETRSYRKYFGAEKRSVLFFDAPKNLKDTAFLSFDHPEPGRDDDQWLYLPALRKSRRISGADRGGAFLGTDFSYEDMKKETKVGLEDYTFRTLRREALGGHDCFVLELVAVSPDVARELGYGRVLAWVDAELWLVRRAEYWDENGAPLKTVRVEEIDQVDGIWTPQRLEATNHRTGHRTVIRFLDVDYESELPDDLFSERALERGR